jgi:hypothetical protein
VQSRATIGRLLRERAGRATPSWSFDVSETAPEGVFRLFGTATGFHVGVVATLG